MNIKTILKLYLFLSIASNTSMLWSMTSTKLYQISFSNETNKELAVTIFFAGGDSLCPNNKLTIEAGQKKIFDTRICCTTSIEIETSQPSSIKKINFQPTQAEFGITCNAFSIAIKERNNEFIIIEL